MLLPECVALELAIVSHDAVGLRGHLRKRITEYVSRIAALVVHRQVPVARLLIYAPRRGINDMAIFDIQEIKDV